MNIEFEKEVRENFNELNEKFNVVKEKFKQNDIFQVEAKKEFNEIREKFKQNDAQHADMMEKLTDIHRIVLLMENDLHKKIPVLFDAYSHNDDEHQIFETRFYDLENLALKNSTKISALEDITKLHSKQLAKLNS